MVGKDEKNIDYKFSLIFIGDSTVKSYIFDLLT
jgi:hypothetical protein